MEAIELVRALIGEIRVIPVSRDERVTLEIVGDLAALLSEERDENAMTASVVAGA